MSTTTETQPAVDGVKVGDVFYRSWGYDQTQVNWYRVVRLTAKRIVVREIPGSVVEGDAYNQRTVPSQDGEPFGPEMVKRVQRYGSSVYCAHNSYSSLYLWDGKPKHETGPYGGH